MLQRRTFIGTALGAAAVSALPKIASAQAKPPFKLFDTHAHFYTNDADKYPFNARAARYGPEKMVVKAMRFPQTPEVIFKFWDQAGIEKGCGVQYNSTYATDNRYLLDISKQYPQRIVPVVILDPVGKDTPAMLEKMAKENRISGVRFTGAPQNGEYIFLGAAAEPAWAAADKLGLVIVLMPLGAMAPALKRVGELAAKYPNVNIVFDHVAFPKPADTPSTMGFLPEHVALVPLKNIYYKYTTLLIEQLHDAKVDPKAFLEYAVKQYGSSQMIWGSDVGNSEGNMLDWVKQAVDSGRGLPLKDQQAVFHDTAARIFVPGGRGPRA